MKTSNVIKYKFSYLLSQAFNNIQNKIFGIYKYVLDEIMYSCSNQM